MTTTYLLTGANTDTSVIATGRVASGAASVRLALSTHADMSTPAYQAAQAPTVNRLVRFPVSGLMAGTRYYAALEIDGVLDTAWVSTFITDAVPAGQPFSFSTPFFSCAPGTGNPVSTGPVHDRIADRRASFNLHLGDFGYPNIGTNDESLFRASWEEQITGAHPALMIKSATLVYEPDDHDKGTNDNDSTNPAKVACSLAYQAVFGHYPLASVDALYFAFTKGRVRFIVTDLRYYRTPLAGTVDADRTMLGSVQEAWFKAEVLAARDDPSILLTVWCATQPPNVSSPPADGNWGGYTTYRKMLWDWFAANGIRSPAFIILAGDIHCMGYKRDVDYSDAQTAPIHHYVSSALDQSYGGSGAYADGGWDGFSGNTGPGGSGQYAVLNIDDQTTHIDVTIDFYMVRRATGFESVSFTDSFTIGTPPLEPGIYAVRDDDGRRLGTFDSDNVQHYVVID